MNIKLQRILKTIVFWSLLAACIFATGYYMRPLDKETSAWSSYYQYDKDSLNVLFVGSSATYRYWQPYQAYEEQGFTSTNVWAAQQDWRSAPYMMEEALKTQHPDVMVVEVRRLLRCAEEPYMTENAFKKRKDAVDFHTKYTMSGMKLSPTKLRMIQDMFGNLSWEKRIEMVVPLLAYHELILDSTLEQYINRENKKLTAFTNALMISDVKRQEWRDGELPEGMELSEESLRYLEMCVEICNRIDTPVLFLLAPYMMTEEDQAMEMKLAEYMQEKGYDYLNLCQSIEEIGLDLESDFYNAGHTNISGAIKYTTYLGDYLNDHYTFTSKLNEKQKVYWDEAIKLWHRTRKKKLAQWAENLEGEVEDESERESDS